MNLFGNDSMLGRIFEFIGHIIMLNLLWILCCIPIVTIGPSTTALYYSVLRMHKGTALAAHKDFFHSFKQNLRQGAIAGMVMTGAGLLLITERNWLSHTPGSAARFLAFAVLDVLVLLFILFLYLFPVISAFSNTLWQLVLHACYFAFRYPLYLLAVLAISFFPMYFTLRDAALLPIYIFFWQFLGFSLTAYANSWFFYRLFKPHLAQDEDDSEA